MSSFKFDNVYIKDYETIVGPKEKESNIDFLKSIDDFYFGEESIEDAEIKMQNVCLTNVLKRNKLNDKLEMLVGGDLLNQIAVTAYNVVNKEIPFLGVYNACATFNESLLVLGNLIDSGKIKNGVAITSSHNLNAERQYRFPVEYGAQKKCYTTFTTTGAAAMLLSRESSSVKLDSGTVGTVVDLGITDVSNMGAVMAPSAAKTLHKHLTELKRDLEYYDIIVTGDLGKLGSNIFLKVIKEDYGYVPKNYIDAASILYKEDQETFQGGSGPVVVPLILADKLLKEKQNKKILLLATGSLHSPLMVNLKKSIPAITHAVSIEVIM